MKILLCFILLIILTRAQWLPKIVWTYWEQQIPNQEHFLRNLKYNHQNMISKDWEYRFLNKKNCWDWLTQIPQAKDLFSSSEFQDDREYQKRSMLIRLLLLKHFGGVWIDYSTILIDNLDWLFKLREIQEIENKQQRDPEVFLIYNRPYNVLLEIYDKQWGIDVVLARFQSIFIASSPNSWLIREWLSFYMLVKKQKQQSNNNQSLIIKIAENQNIWIPGYSKQEKNQLYISLHIVLQRRQRQISNQLSKNDKLLQKKTVTGVHSIWTAQIYRLGYRLDAIQWSFPQAFMVTDAQKLKQINAFPKYFFKMTSFARERFLGKLNSYYNFVITKNTIAKNLCPISAYIQNKSMFYLYMLQFYPIQFLKGNVTAQDEEEYNFNLCYFQAYKQLKRTSIDFSQKPEPFLLVSQKQYKDYQKILKNKIMTNNNDVTKIPFSLIRQGLKVVFPQQIYKLMLIIQPQGSVNVRSFKNAFPHKLLFVFTNSDLITIQYAQLYYQINNIIINKNQFFRIKIIGENLSQTLYVFNNKHLKIQFQYVIDRNSHQEYKQFPQTELQDKNLISEIKQTEIQQNIEKDIQLQYFRLIQQLKQNQSFTLLILCTILGLFTITYPYYMLIYKKKSKNEE